MSDVPNGNERGLWPEPVKAAIGCLARLLTRCRNVGRAWHEHERVSRGIPEGTELPDDLAQGLPERIGTRRELQRYKAQRRVGKSGSVLRLLNWLDATDDLTFEVRECRQHLADARLALSGVAAFMDDPQKARGSGWTAAVMGELNSLGGVLDPHTVPNHPEALDIDALARLTKGVARRLSELKRVPGLPGVLPDQAVHRKRNRPETGLPEANMDTAEILREMYVEDVARLKGIISRLEDSEPADLNNIQHSMCARKFLDAAEHHLRVCESQRHGQSPQRAEALNAVEKLLGARRVAMNAPPTDQELADVMAAVDGFCGDILLTAADLARVALGDGGAFILEHRLRSRETNANAEALLHRLRGTPEGATGDPNTDSQRSLGAEMTQVRGKGSAPVPPGPQRGRSRDTVVLWEGAPYTEGHLRLARTRTAYLEANGNVARALAALKSEGFPMARSTFYNHLDALDKQIPRWRAGVQLSNPPGIPDGR